MKAYIPVMRCRAKRQCLSLVSVVSSFDDQNMDLEQGCESKEIKWVPKAVVDDNVSCHQMLPQVLCVFCGIQSMQYIHIYVRLHEKFKQARFFSWYGILICSC